MPHTSQILHVGLPNPNYWKIFTMKSCLIPQIFWSGDPSFLVLLLSTDCQGLHYPKFAYQTFCLPLATLVQDLCFTLLEAGSGKATFGSQVILAGVYQNIIPLTPQYYTGLHQLGLVQVSVGSYLLE